MHITIPFTALILRPPDTSSGTLHVQTLVAHPGERRIIGLLLDPVSYPLRPRRLVRNLRICTTEEKEGENLLVHEDWQPEDLYVTRDDVLVGLRVYPMTVAGDSVKLDVGTLDGEVHGGTWHLLVE